MSSYKIELALIDDDAPDDEKTQSLSIWFYNSSTDAEGDFLDIDFDLANRFQKRRAGYIRGYNRRKE